MKRFYYFQKALAFIIAVNIIFLLNIKFADGQAHTFTSGSLTYSQNFDVMGPSGTTYPTGWTGYRYDGTGTIGAILNPVVTDGSASSGAMYNVGTTSDNDRALGSLASGSTYPRFGCSFLNNTGGNITSIDFSFFMEQWRSGSSNTVNEVVIFEYSLNATSLSDGDWIAYSALDLNEKLTSTTSAAAVNGNDAANRTAVSSSLSLTWPNSTSLWIRWSDADNTGSDGIYSVDDLSMTVTFSTSVDPEPTNHVTGFTTGTITYNSIVLNWTGSTGSQLPAGYLLLGKKGAGTYAAVADGTPVANDADWGDNNFAINLTHTSGANSYTLTGLAENTQYDFIIYPYTNSGANINFKTDGTVPTTSGTTLIAPVTIESEDFTTCPSADWLIVNQDGDNKLWACDAGSMKANGYGATPSGSISDDWLISPALNLNNYSNEVLTFETKTQYTGPALKCKYSTNYSGSGNPNVATWTELTFTPATTTTWVSSGNVDLSGINGSSVYIAFHYTSTGTASGEAASWWVDNIVITGVLTASPDPEPSNHVTGFSSPSHDFKSITLQWTGSTGTQLPAGYLILGKKAAGVFASVADGTPVADDANWSDNNFAQNVVHQSGTNTLVIENLTAETTYDFVIYPYTNSGSLIDYKTDGAIPSVSATTDNSPVLYTAFNSDLDGWTAVSVASDKNWQWSSGYALINGYGADVASEDWLISPELNLNNYTSEILTFKSWTKFTDIISGLELKYTTNYTGNPSTTTWNALSPTLPAANSQVWTSSGNIDISGITGTAVRFAFKYVSSGNGTGTSTQWEVDDIIITGTAGSVVVDYDSKVTNPDIQVESYSYSSLLDTPGEAVPVFKFKILDFGTSDGLPTIVSQITLKPGPLNTANWATTIGGIKLLDQEQIPVSGVSITNEAITVSISGTNLQVLDDTLREITVLVYFTTTVVDGSVLQFTIPAIGHGFVASGSSSVFATDFGSALTSSIFPIDVEATKLTITVPSNFIPNTNFSVTVNAKDANNNLDIDNQATVTLTASGGGVLSSATGLTQNLVSGSFVWSDIRYSAEETITITASATGFDNVVSSSIQPQGNIPAGYYDAAAGLSGAALKTALYNIIKGHTVLSYDYLWTAFQTTDVRGDGKVWDMYSNCTFTFITNQCGTYSSECDCYNREHSFPKSWFNDVAPMNSDLYMVVPTDGYVNGIRGNYAFGVVGTANYTSSNGCKRGNNIYPGYSGTVFEPADEFKGDFARIYFYMATRYENLIAGWENYDSDGDAMMDGSSYPCFEPWALNMLLEWNANDPVSPKEISRNNAVYALQNNRNPFIDHPEWVNAIWNPSSCTPPTQQASGFLSSGITQNQATISWTRGNGDAVLVLAYEGGPVNQDPADGSTYTANSTFGSGSVIGTGNYVVYKGTGTSVTVTGLKTGTSYHFAIYEYDEPGYCYNSVQLTGNITTLPKAEPTNHVTNFAQGSVTSNSVTVTWTDATGSVLPDFYLIRFSKVGYANIPVPVDGTPVANNDSVLNMAYGSQECTFTGLSAQTTYYFKIYPYSNTGSQINYKTDETVPQLLATTSAAPAGGTETFNNLDAGGSYVTGTFTGQDGSTWNYVKCRGDLQITGKAITMGKAQTPPSEFYSGTISGGADIISFDYKQAYSTNANFQLLINGTLVQAFTTNTEEGVLKNSGNIAINQAGDFVIKFQQTNSSSGQVTIDNIHWEKTIDNIPPTVTFVPANNATNVLLNTTVQLTFSEAVRKTDGNPITDSDIVNLVEFRKTNASGALVSFTGTISENKKVITLTPSALLDINQLYYVALKTAVVEDMAGNDAAAIEITFTTVNPTLALTSPVNNSTYYQGNNLNIAWTSLYIDSVIIQISRAGTLLQSVTRLATASPYNYSIAANAIASPSYKIFVQDKLHSSVKDSVIITVADTTKPLVVSLSPVNNATGVSLTANLVINLNEPVYKGTGNISIYTSADFLQSALDVNSANIDVNGQQITIQHPDFTGLTSYYVLIPLGVIVDQSGNSLIISDKTTWNFTTLDNIPPQVTLNPANGSIGVPVNANLTITFSEPVRKLDNSVLQNADLASMLILKTPDQNGTNVAFTATVNPGKTIITIDPSVNFDGEQNYYFGISAMVEDASDNNITATFATFTTASADVPVITFTPDDGAINVPVSANILISFSEPVRKIDNSPVENADLASFIVFKKDSPAGVPVGFTAFINTEKTVITVDPNSDLLSETTYYIQLTAGLEDEQDNPVDAVSATFTTMDVIPPVAIFDPADGSTNVNDNADIIITFSEPVRKGDHNPLENADLTNYLVFAKENSSGQPVPYSATINQTKTQIVINPDNLFESEQLYYVGITGSIEDYAGNAFVPVSISFTSEDNLPPVATFTPSNGTVNVDNNANFTIQFSEPVRKADDSAVENADLAALVILRTTNVSGQDVAFSAVINSEKTLITVDPAETLASEQVYYFAITAGLEDKNNNPLAAAFVTFTSKDNLPPVVTINPADQQDAVPVNQVVTFSFSEPVYKSGGAAITPSDIPALTEFRYTDINGQNVSYTAAVTPTSFILTPVNMLDYNQVYYAALKQGVVFDQAGNAAGTAVSVFTTVSQPTINQETFANLGNSTSYIDGTFTGQDGSTWSYTKARGDQTINGKAICFQNTGNPYVLSGTLQNGIKSVKFLHQQKFSGSGGKIKAVEINGVNQLPAEATVTTTVDSVMIDDINVAGPFTIKIITNGIARIAVDDIKWTNFVQVSSIIVSSVEGVNTINTDNGTLHMTATVLPANANDRSITWSVENGTGMATIDQSGLLTAIANGTVTVKATANDGSGVSGSLEVIISNQIVLVENITLSTQSGLATISTDDGTLQMIATITPAYATNKNVTWSVTNQAGIAVIDQSGLLTAVSNGTVLVVATANDGSGISGSLQIFISNQVVPVSSIVVSSINNRDTIDVDNGTLQMLAEVLPVYATNKAVEWSVINQTGVAVISQDGLLQAVAGGNVTVKATALDGSGVVGTKQVVLINQIDDILVTQINITSAENTNLITTDNGTLQLIANILPANATNQTVNWSITNQTGVASISNTGLVTAIADGTVVANATATDGSNVSGTFEIVISNQVELVQSIVVQSASDEISIDNGTLQMTAVVSPLYANNKTVTWSVTNQTGIATIDQSGLLTAVSNGTVLVTATANDGSGVSGSKQITLLNQFVPVTSVSITSQSGLFEISTDNGTLQLQANVLPIYASLQTVDWAVINQTGIATITQSGLVAAVKNGTVKVKASATDGSNVSDSVVITISNQVVPVESIIVTSQGGVDAINVDNGTLQMIAEVSPSYADNTTVTWSVVNVTGIATISQSGLLTAVANGVVTVTATANDGSGVSGSKNITISGQFVPVESITVVSQSGQTTISVDDGTLQMIAQISPSYASNTSVTWSVENQTGVAIISTNGLLTAVANGTVLVKATSTDGTNITGTLQITLTNQIVPVASIAITSQTGQFVINTDNGTLQLNAVITPSYATNQAVTWSVDNITGEATITQTGLLTAVDNGVVEVTASATDGSGVSGAVTITITNQDNQAPQFVSPYPSIASITQVSASLEVKLNEPGMVFYQVKTVNQAPSVAELLATTGVNVPAANQVVSVALSGLTDVTQYYVFVIARDIAQNVQAAPVMVGFTTDGYAPQITQQPSGANVCLGGQITLSVTATGSAPLTYTWYHDDEVVSGENTNQLIIQSANYIDAGNYYCKVSNTAGQINSQTVQVEVLPPVLIVQQPVSGIACEGQTFTFEVVASGAALTYQWYKNAQIITGQTSSTLVLTNVSSADDASYYCSLSGTCTTSLLTQTVTLTVNATPFAGNDSDITVYDTLATMNLFDYLTGSPDAGGTWYDETGSVVAGGNFSPSASGAGEYIFMYVVGSSPCQPDTAYLLIVVEHYTSVAELDRMPVKVYPNPFTDNIYIFSHTPLQSVEILNNCGKLIHIVRELKVGENVMPAGELPQGIYMLKIITSGGRMQIQKIVRQ